MLLLNHSSMQSFCICSLAYLKEVAGPRTIPVELGSRYTDEEWSQKLMTLTNFIDNYVMSQVQFYQQCTIAGVGC